MKAENTTILKEICSYLLVLLFTYAGIIKLLDVEQFTFELSQSPLLPAFSVPLVAHLLPAAEVITALLLVFEKTRTWALYISFFIMFIFTVYLIALVGLFDNVPCACGGILGKISYPTHIMFNVFFTGVALAGCLLDEKKIPQKA